MKPEKQNIEIAKFCGWKWDDASIYSPNEGRWARFPWGIDQLPNVLPDYLNDLNAMHEAIRLLTNEQMVKFIRILGLDVLKLCPLAGEFWWADEIDCYAMITATPEQYAETLLRTIGKWGEE